MNETKTGYQTKVLCGIFSTIILIILLSGCGPVSKSASKAGKEISEWFAKIFDDSAIKKWWDEVAPTAGKQSDDSVQSFGPPLEKLSPEMLPDDVSVSIPGWLQYIAAKSTARVLVELNKRNEYSTKPNQELIQYKSNYIGTVTQGDVQGPYNLQITLQKDCDWKLSNDFSMSIKFDGGYIVSSVVSNVVFSNVGDLKRRIEIINENLWEADDKGAKKIGAKENITTTKIDVFKDKNMITGVEEGEGKRIISIGADVLFELEYDEFLREMLRNNTIKAIASVFNGQSEQYYDQYWISITPVETKARDVFLYIVSTEIFTPTIQGSQERSFSSEIINSDGIVLAGSYESEDFEMHYYLEDFTYTQVNECKG